MAWIAYGVVASQISKYISLDPLIDGLQCLDGGTAKAVKNFQSILDHARGITATASKHADNVAQLSVVLLGLTCVLLTVVLLRGVFGPAAAPDGAPGGTGTLEALVLWVLGSVLSSVVMVLFQFVLIPMGQAEFVKRPAISRDSPLSEKENLSGVSRFQQTHWIFWVLSGQADPPGH